MTPSLHSRRLSFAKPVALCALLTGTLVAGTPAGLRPGRPNASATPSLGGGGLTLTDDDLTMANPQGASWNAATCGGREYRWTDANGPNSRLLHAYKDWRAPHFCNGVLQGDWKSANLIERTSDRLRELSIYRTATSTVALPYSTVTAAMRFEPLPLFSSNLDLGKKAKFLPSPLFSQRFRVKTNAPEFFNDEDACRFDHCKVWQGWGWMIGCAPYYNMMWDTPDRDLLEVGDEHPLQYFTGLEFCQVLGWGELTRESSLRLTIHDVYRIPSNPPAYAAGLTDDQWSPSMDLRTIAYRHAERPSVWLEEQTTFDGTVTYILSNGGTGVIRPVGTLRRVGHLVQIPEVDPRSIPCGTTDATTFMPPTQLESVPGYLGQASFAVGLMRGYLSSELGVDYNFQQPLAPYFREPARSITMYPGLSARVHLARVYTSIEFEGYDAANPAGPVYNQDNCVLAYWPTGEVRAVVEYTAAACESTIELQPVAESFSFSEVCNGNPRPAAHDLWGRHTGVFCHPEFGESFVRQPNDTSDWVPPTETPLP